METIYLCDLKSDLVGAWQYAIDSYPQLKSKIKIGCVDVTTLKADAVVSPGNSFGFMTGGIDLVYKQFFGESIQTRVQDKIKDSVLQELLVGQAVVVETLNKDVPYLIYAPTMRVPRWISYSSDVYLSTKIACLMGTAFNMNSIIIPGMGSGCGGIVPHKVAKIMFQAISDALTGNPFPASLQCVQMQ